MPAAASLLGRASEVLPAEHPTRPWLLIRTGEAKLEMGEFASAADLAEKAIEIASALEDPALEATARIERLRLRYITDAAGSDAQVASQVHELVPTLEAAGDEAGLARAWRLLTYVQVAAAQWGAAEEAASATLDHARASGDRLMEVRGLPALAGIARYGPLTVTEALGRCNELLVRAEGDRRAETLILRAIAHLHAMEGDFPTAREITSQVRRTLEELGANFDAALVSLDSGPIEMMAGDPGAAVLELQRDYQTLDRMGERNYITTTAAYLAEALYRAGREGEASEYAAFSESVAAEDDLLTQLLWRGVRGKILARSGRFDDGLAMAREAVRLAHTSDDPTAQGNALADLAEVYMLGGQASEATTALDAAMARVTGSSQPSTVHDTACSTIRRLAAMYAPRVSWRSRWSGLMLRTAAI